jgi:hypothetical protein
MASSLGTATFYVLDGPGLEISSEAQDFLFNTVQTGTGAHPASCSVGTAVLTWG